MDHLSPDEIVQRAAEAGMSMAQVCRAAGVNPSVWQRWKNGETSPTLRTCERLSAVLTSPKPKKRAAA